MRRPLATAAFLLVALGSLVVLFDPRPGDPLPVAHADKAVHALTFAALAATARWRFGALPAVVLGLVAYAVGSELVQARWLAFRTGDVVDVVADLLGAAVGWWAVRVVAREGHPR